jgi:hypothetical protein
MTGRVQSLRSSVAGSRPTGRQPGELYVNFADGQLGVVNATSAAQDLIGVTYFSTSSAYAVGQFVIQAGQLYRCVNVTGPGAFTPAAWGQIGGSIVVGDSPPANPQPGTLWWDSVGGQLYVLYNDGNTVQWVIVVNTANFPSITIGATPPVNPAIGSLWWDSVGGQMYIWFNDGNTSQWVAATNQIGGGYLPLTGGVMTGPVALMGVTDGSDAAPGQIGEVISSVVTTGVPLTSGTGINLTSISLTPGDWDVSGDVWIVVGTGGAAIVTGAISSVSGAFPVMGINGGRTQICAAISASSSNLLSVNTVRVSVTATTPYYLIVLCTFPSGTTTATGYIWARRAR